MQEELIELKKIKYKLMDDIHQFEKMDEIGCLPDECHEDFKNTVALKCELEELIEKFDKVN